MAAPARVLRRLARNRSLLRVVTGYALFTIAEYSVWIGVLVYAYDHGGATTAGLVALAQLLPAALAAPLLATVADRRSPLRLLVLGYAVQGAAIAALAVALFAAAPPLAAYAAAVVASTAVVTTRPAQAALVPTLSRDVQELTAANAVIGWVESASIVIAGTGTGLTLALGGLADLFAGAAVLLAIAVWAVVPLRDVATAAEPATLAPAAGVWAHVASGVGEVARNQPAALLVGLLGAEYVVVGALDVLFVVLAIDVLEQGQAWAGYLNTGYGVGGTLLGSLGAVLVGRRLGPVIAISALLVGAALAATALVPRPGVTLVLLAAAGGGRALFDLSTRSLLQRAVPAGMVGRVFGLAEGLSMAGLAIGSLLAPALVAVGGGRSALLGVGVVLPLVVLVLARRVLALDRGARVPVVEIALLRATPIFGDLPGPALEGVAGALERLDVDPGHVVLQEGAAGEHYYAIADGELEIVRGGRRVALLGRGVGVGEIALLQGVPRTASAVARTHATLYALDRASFLTAVNGHVPTRRRATRLAEEIRARDADAQEDPTDQPTPDPF